MNRAGHGGFWDILDNVEKIRNVLRDRLGPIKIEFHCFNYAEVEDTRARLTEEERTQVRFFWLEFDKGWKGDQNDK